MADEWQYLYPGLDVLIELLVAIKRRNSTQPRMEPSELCTLLIEVKEQVLTNPEPSNRYEHLQWIASYFPDNNDPRQIVSILYDLGIIGYRNKEESTNFRYSSELAELPEINKNARFQIHPMYEKISTRNVSLGGDNPWH